jgi:thioredoxin-related protein
MKKILLLVALLAAFATQAQDWQTDIATAKALAQKEHKKIVLVFQGSDWCAPCIKLERTIWESENFKALAKNSFVMLKADFPRKKKNQLEKVQQEKNNALAEAYNPNGYFPYVVVLDENGKILGSTGYKKLDPKAYFELLNSF